MNVEAALIELGEKPLRRSPYSSTLLLILNAYLPGDNPVSPESTGQEILSKVYQLPDTKLQERLMERPLGEVRGRDSYRTVLLVLSGFMGIIGIALAISEIVSPQGTLSGDALNKIIDGSFSIIKLLL